MCQSAAMLLLWVVLAAEVPVVDAGVKPEAWRLSAKLGVGRPERESFVAELTRGNPDAGSANGEMALTAAEVDALLADERSELIYTEKTISIVAPSMLRRHRQEHIELMKRFLAPERIEAGLQFMRDKRDVLHATALRTHVTPEVIVGILMWESKLGTITGDYVAFNALASQAFFVEEANAVALAKPEEKAELRKRGPNAEANQQRRVETIRNRARKNLVVLIRQCKARGIDVLGVKGSWAGALGFPQFMPASLRWAEDGNGDGQINLFDMDDAIASVGRYLAQAGFKKSPREAVYHYNHEDAYVDGVLAFAEALQRASAPDGGIDAGTHSSGSSNDESK